MVHGRDPHERGGGDARREPEHAALLGAALRLPRAAAQRRRAPAVRPRRDRGAAGRLPGDPERLVGDHARPRPRRRSGQPVAPARRAPALRRGRGRPRPGGEPRGALGGAQRRGGAPRRRSPRSTRDRPRRPSHGAGRPGGWPRPSASRRPRAARRRSSSSIPARPGTPTASTPRPSSSRSVAAACARSTLGAALDHVRLARALHAVGPRVVVLTGRHASLDALARLVYTARHDGDPRRGVRLSRRAARDGCEHGRAPRREAAGRGRAHRRGRRRPPGRVRRTLRAVNI